MRQIVLDTETTGLTTADGHRIIEIGCIELQNRRYTRNHFHQYFNPARQIDVGALQVHGITSEFLEKQPFFRDHSQRLLEFIAGAELIIHNATFDMGFLDYEFSLITKNFPGIAHYCTIIDTLALARKKHPGQQNSLDALCRRYQVDNSHRDYHGALLDAKLLAEVYLAMTGGQGTLFGEQENNPVQQQSQQARPVLKTEALPVILPTPEEEAAHLQRLAAINKKSGKVLWDTDKIE